MRTEVQNNPKQLNQKSSIQAEKIKNKQPRKLALRFSPTAWAKLLYFRDRSDNEIGGFGITEPDDLLFVREFATVKQEVTGVSVRFDDSAVADFFDQQVDLGRKPEQFARIWLHTHPADCPQPSAVDEETFMRVFGKCHWAIMFILAQNNKTYARISFNIGPGGQVLVPAEVDYSCDFGPTNKQSWETEYQANIKATAFAWQDEGVENSKAVSPSKNLDSYAMPYDLISEFEKMNPEERRLILDELAERPDLWEDEGVMYL